MTRRIVDLRRQRPLLDIASFGRRGPQPQIRLNAATLETIRRTVRRAPEVVVKISGGGTTARQVLEHFRYIQRRGDLEIETDTDEKLRGKGSHRRLLDDWDLDLEVGRAPGQRTGPTRQPRLVHNIVFSMPPGTPPKALLAAVYDFADSEWGGRHRYAMVLHTDASHPHVHVVVKAMSKLGERLNPDPAMLREWRAAFAERLRARGVDSNATDRAIRGAARPPKHDGRYWAERRGAGVRQRQQLLDLASEVRRGERLHEAGRTRLEETRRQVIAGWSRAVEVLERLGNISDAEAAQSFVHRMPAVRTELELLAEEWARYTRERNMPDHGLPPR